MPGPSTQGPYRSLIFVLALALIAAGIVVRHWRQGRPHREIAQLSPMGRAAIYDHESNDFRIVCAGQSIDPPTATLCKRKAERLAQFPECDAACQTAAADFMKLHP